MKEYRSLIEQYKGQDSHKELKEENNDTLHEAHCLDDDDCFDLDQLCNCTSAGCVGFEALCEGLGDRDCLDCNNKY